MERAGVGGWNAVLFITPCVGPGIPTLAQTMRTMYQKHRGFSVETSYDAEENKVGRLCPTISRCVAYPMLSASLNWTRNYIITQKMFILPQLLRDPLSVARCLTYLYHHGFSTWPRT